MVAKELNPELPQDNSDLKEFDDAEETLSLCDLPLSSSASDWDEYVSEEDQSSSFEQDCFEFFSENFTASTFPTDNIIFCGKIIQYKGAEVAYKAQDSDNTSKPKENKIVPRKSGSFNKPRMNSSKMQRGKSYKTCRTLTVPQSKTNVCATAKSVKKYDYSMKNISLLESPMKSRWYLFAFGVGRFPMEMELTDIKKRQKKQSPANYKMFQSDNGREMVSSNVRRRKGLWGLIGALGCTSYEASAAVNASITQWKRNG